ncbi:TIGR04222 domain-containing membrane protein [Streptomyces sp. MAR4 CNX-425]|uniref:TIGR04222 domain-containing membrane protein n=1 Tax=Streptomyces sp. MAR4 CNX-425 TaxID=3406343 RepID=UPI003B50962A
MGAHALQAVVAALCGLTLLTWAWIPLVRRRVLADYARAAGALPPQDAPEPDDLSAAELALLAGGPARLTRVLLTELYLAGRLELTRTPRLREYAVAARADGPERDDAAPSPPHRALLAQLPKRQPAPLKQVLGWGLLTDEAEELWQSLAARGLRPHDRHLHRARGRYAIARLLLVLSMSLGFAVVIYGTFAGMALARDVAAGLPYLAAGLAMAAGSGLLMLWSHRVVGRVSPRTATGDRLVRRAQEQYCRRFGEGGDDVPEELPPDLALRRLAVSGSVGTYLSASAHCLLRPTDSPAVWPDTAHPERVAPPQLWDFLRQQESALADFGPFGSHRLWRRAEVPQGPEFVPPGPEYFSRFYVRVPDHSR